MFCALIRVGMFNEICIFTSFFLPVGGGGINMEKLTVRIRKNKYEPRALYFVAGAGNRYADAQDSHAHSHAHAHAHT